MLRTLLFLLMLGNAGGQQGSVNPKLLAPLDPDLRLPVKDLHVTSSTSTEVPTFSFFNAARCDKDGEVFFHLNTGSLNNMEVLGLKVTAGSAEPTMYRAPSEFTESKNGFFINFSVTPSGDLWMLGESKQRKYVLFKFDSEGKPTSQTNLGVPEHLDLRDFAVSDQGLVLVSGNFDRDADANLRGKRFAAMLNASGQLLQEVDLKADKVDFSSVGLHEGAAVFGDDGLFYVLMPEGVLALSQAGSAVHRINFDKPKDFAATHLAVSGGYLAVWLQKINKNGPLTTEFLVINADTGESVARYRTTPETGNLALCFSRKDGFTMWQVENQRVKLMTASPR